MPRRSRVAYAVDEVGQTVALFRPKAEAAGLALPMQVGGDMPAALKFLRVTTAGSFTKPSLMAWPSEYP